MGGSPPLLPTPDSQGSSHLAAPGAPTQLSNCLHSTCSEGTGPQAPSRLEMAGGEQEEVGWGPPGASRELLRDMGNEAQEGPSDSTEKGQAQEG